MLFPGKGKGLSSLAKLGNLQDIFALPEEILIQLIFSRLPVHSQVALLSVSRHFRSILSSRMSMDSSSVSISQRILLKSVPSASFRVGVYSAAGYDSNALFCTLSALEGSSSSPSDPTSMVSLCLSPEEGVLVQLSFHQIPFLSDPKDRSGFRGFHAAAVMYYTSDVYSLLESAKYTIGEINKFAVPVPLAENSSRAMATQVLLVGNVTRRDENQVELDGASVLEKPPADLERASTLSSICKRVEFVGGNEIDPTNLADVGGMARFLARVCYKTSVAKNMVEERTGDLPVRARRARGCIVM